MQSSRADVAQPAASVAILSQYHRFCLSRPRASRAARYSFPRHMLEVGSIVGGKLRVERILDKGAAAVTW
jgi:hypothetical protein